MKTLGIISGICVVLMALSPSAGASVTFTENWDSHTVNQAPGAPWYIDSHSTGSTWVEDDGAQLSDPYSLLINNAGFNGRDFGTQTMLPISGGMPEVAGTNANPLIIDYYLYHNAAEQRGKADIYVEISLGDVHAPALGVVESTPIPVLAYCKPYSENAAYQYFDGQQWYAAGFADWGSWDELILTIKSNTVDVEKRGVNNSGPYTNVPRSYQGNFDRISIRTIDYAWTTWSSIDDLSVVGGEAVPEPATLLVLALGGLVLLRRRR